MRTNAEKKNYNRKNIEYILPKIGKMRFRTTTKRIEKRNQIEIYRYIAAFTIDIKHINNLLVFILISNLHVWAINLAISWIFRFFLFFFCSSVARSTILVDLQIIIELKVFQQCLFHESSCFIRQSMDFSLALSLYCYAVLIYFQKKKKYFVVHFFTSFIHLCNRIAVIVAFAKKKKYIKLTVKSK